MKNFTTVCFLLLVMACANPKIEKQVVELSCGQCQFGLTTQEGCDLAARIDGKSYFVDGADIDEFGDAHDKDSGFCEVVRKAEVEGEVIDGRFKVASVKMLDQ
ncbi:hypothetical protein FBALC1_01537 [Flavobacteriales bacterium ALC-1]|nr:hypothetical protein FBALC1_01537 [Flavobacteriales bacterium ALC-1]